jgi:thymidine kinase
MSHTKSTHSFCNNIYHDTQCPSPSDQLQNKEYSVFDNNDSIPETSLTTTHHDVSHIIKSPDNDIQLQNTEYIICDDDLKLRSKPKYMNEYSIRHRGTLYLRIGPMFSGKTSWLNGELTQLADKKFSVLKITHCDDIRDDVSICDESGSTHNSSYKSISDKITCRRLSTLKDLDVSDFNVIGIDESQFFNDLLETVNDWVENNGKHVRVAGLDGDTFKRKFGQILDLIPFCDEVIKLKASCKICLRELEDRGFHGNILAIEGPFTKRLHFSKEQKIIGGSDIYIPVCRYHHSI